MAEEKIFTIPLRKVFEAERTKRANKAVSVVKQFLEKHMKSEDIMLGNSINKQIWARGIQKPPRRIRVHAIKEDDRIFAELVGIEIKTPSAEVKTKKEEKAKKKEEKIKEDRKERKKLALQEKLEKEEGVEREQPVEEKTEEKKTE